MPARTRWPDAAYLLVALLALTCGTGCPVVSNLPAPGRVIIENDPVCNREYRLYVPTQYRPDETWPLVVVCHGTPPFDTARLQFGEWKGMAERYGFLLATPELIGTAGTPQDAAAQIARQIEDERAILSIVRTVRAARSVDETRVFLTGWSAGSYAVLYTGLRNPDVFRALAIRQGSFDARFVEPCVPFLDPNQPIVILFGSTDPLHNSPACIDWLRQHDLQPVIVEQPGSHRRGPEPVFNFFRDVVRNQPWIRLHVRDNPTDPMQITFTARASFAPVKFRWDFGDQQGSAEAAPAHRYEKPGLYAVRVALWASDKRYHIRRVQLQVPRTRIGVRTTAPTNDER